jgi:hypothetical protein
LDAEPKYAVEKLNRVLRAMGCKGEISRLDHITLAWWNPKSAKAGQLPAIATFHPDRGQLSIRQDHVVAIALTLELDPDQVLQRLKRAGGEILEPWK